MMWSQYQRAMMLGVLFFGVIAGGGLSLAAESALPGQLLYPLKTKVNEPLVTLLAPSVVSKIWWQAEVINRRLVESELVLTQIKTKPLTVQTLTNDITTQVSKLERDLGSLDDREAKTLVKHVSGKLEAELRTHSRVITEAVVANKNIIPSVEQLDRAVREQTEKLSKLKTIGTAAATTTLEEPTPPPTITPSPQLPAGPAGKTPGGATTFTPNPAN